MNLDIINDGSIQKYQDLQRQTLDESLDVEKLEKEQLPSIEAASCIQQLLE